MKGEEKMQALSEQSETRHEWSISIVQFVLKVNGMISSELHKITLLLCAIDQYK